MAEKLKKFNKKASFAPFKCDLVHYFLLFWCEKGHTTPKKGKNALLGDAIQKM